MVTITIPKNKYDLLKKKAHAYEVLKKMAARGGFFDIPSTKNKEMIIRGFRRSGKHNEAFIASLERGLERSDYFK